MLKRRHIRRLIDYNKLIGLVTTDCELSLQAKGYLRIVIDNKTYRLSNVVYVLIHGSIPEHATVIQLNKNKLDFRLDNLYLDMSKAEKIKKQEVLQEQEERFKSRQIGKDFYN